MPTTHAIDDDTSHPGGHAPRRVDLTETLRGAVASGIISPEQADAIRRDEAERAATVKRRGGGEIPLVTEVLAYVGAMLATGAVAVLLGLHWADLGVSAHVTVDALVTVALLAGGWRLRDSREPAFERLASVLWLLSAVAFGGLVAIFGVDVWKPSAATTALAACGATVVYAGVLWAWRPRAAQLFALWAACMGTVIAGLVRGDATATTSVLAPWVFGLAWLGLTRLGALRPVGASYALGALPVLAAPFVTDLGWPVFLGLVSAGAVMAASVWLRQTKLLFMGAVALFLYVLRVGIQYFAPALGLPVSLLVAGLALIGVALLTAHMYRAPDEGSDAKR
ncbi:MAG TPA: DUF2157 domain-containing protein [Actinomycetota bacterium]|nr:DUF2157 domain-containing protein [Actinomycetota bacterium]